MRPPLPPVSTAPSTHSVIENYYKGCAVEWSNVLRRRQNARACSLPRLAARQPHWRVGGGGLKVVRRERARGATQTGDLAPIEREHASFDRGGWLVQASNNYGGATKRVARATSNGGDFSHPKQRQEATVSAESLALRFRFWSALSSGQRCLLLPAQLHFAPSLPLPLLFPLGTAQTAKYARPRNQTKHKHARANRASIGSKLIKLSRYVRLQRQQHEFWR